MAKCWGIEWRNCANNHQNEMLDTTLQLPAGSWLWHCCKAMLLASSSEERPAS